MRDVWVSYRRSSRMTLTERTSSNSRTDCNFDITVRSWKQSWLDPLIFINVRLASYVGLSTCLWVAHLGKSRIRQPSECADRRKNTTTLTVIRQVRESNFDNNHQGPRALPFAWITLFNAVIS